MPIKPQSEWGGGRSCQNTMEVLLWGTGSSHIRNHLVAEHPIPHFQTSFPDPPPIPADDLPSHSRENWSGLKDSSFYPPPRPAKDLSLQPCHPRLFERAAICPLPKYCLYYITVSSPSCPLSAQWLSFSLALMANSRQTCFGCSQPGEEQS